MNDELLPGNRWPPTYAEAPAGKLVTGYFPLRSLHLLEVVQLPGLVLDSLGRAVEAETRKDAIAKEFGFFRPRWQAGVRLVFLVLNPFHLKPYFFEKDLPRENVNTLYPFGNVAQI